MKILQINTAVNSGSTGRIAEDIGNVLLENNHQSYIAYGRGNRPSQSQLIKIGSNIDNYSHGLLTLLLDKHGLGSKKATKDFIYKIQELQPDLIGIHNIHGYYLNYSLLFSYIKENKIPVIWTFHDCWPITGHCAYFESVNCQKWKTQCYKCPLTQNYPKSFTDRSYQNHKDKKSSFLGVKNLHIVTPSIWLKNIVNQSFLKEYPIQIIHNGVDLTIFKPQPKRINTQEKIVLGVASTWDPRKGLTDFLKLRNSLPKNYKIVLIGLNKKQKRNLPHGIIGISRTESINELVSWYNKATVFVNPTYVDNFPTTNIEALACGTPVVTYNTGGSPEAICNHTGVVVPKGDHKALMSAILSIDKSKEIIQNCRQRAEQYFNAKHRYQDYLSLYQRISKK